MILDYYLVYQFVRRLSTPFREWNAYKLDIIDENGNVLKKRRELRTREEKQAFGAFDVMVLNLKKLIERLPAGKTRLASYAAALFLLREWNHFTPDSMLTESVSDIDIEKTVNLFFNGYTDYNTLSENVNIKMHDLNELFEQKFTLTRTVKEDVPTNNVGSGNIPGLGIGPDGEPGFTRKQQKRYKKDNKMLRRFSTFKEEEEQRAKQHLNKKHTRPTKSATIPTDRIS